jgi:hypothetical protein
MAMATAKLAFLTLALSTSALAQSGYVINSDDPATRDFDSLHRVALPTGQAIKIGEARASANDAPYLDIEGMAIGETGIFAIDDATKTLLRVDKMDGRTLPVDGREGNTGLPRNTALDFGLTFDCSGNLFASSDTRRTLYRLNPTTGAATIVGAEGALGAPITALAARGDKVFGIGTDGNENLYSINVNTGVATLIGPLGAGLRFSDAGMDFDADGQLWAIADLTNGSPAGEPSAIFKINTSTGAAERIASTLAGVESLAIAAPVCSAQGEPEPAPPAIPTLNALGLSLLGLVLMLIGGATIRRWH